MSDLTKETMEIMADRIMERLDKLERHIEKVEAHIENLEKAQNVFFERLITVENNLKHLECDTKERIEKQSNDSQKNIESALNKMQLKFVYSIISAFLVPIILSIILRYIK